MSAPRVLENVLAERSKRCDKSLSVEARASAWYKKIGVEGDQRFGRTDVFRVGERGAGVSLWPWMVVKYKKTSRE